MSQRSSSSRSWRRAVAITAESAGWTSSRLRERIVTWIERVSVPDLLKEVSGTSSTLRWTPRTPASARVLGELSNSMYVPADTASVSGPMSAQTSSGAACLGTSVIEALLS
jgi:hypothetical protein